MDGLAGLAQGLGQGTSFLGANRVNQLQIEETAAARKARTEQEKAELAFREKATAEDLKFRENTQKFVEGIQSRMTSLEETLRPRETAVKEQAVTTDAAESRARIRSMSEADIFRRLDYDLAVDKLAVEKEALRSREADSYRTFSEHVRQFNTDSALRAKEAARRDSFDQLKLLTGMQDAMTEREFQVQMFERTADQRTRESMAETMAQMDVLLAKDRNLKPEDIQKMKRSYVRGVLGQYEVLGTAMSAPADKTSVARSMATVKSFLSRERDAAKAMQAILDEPGADPDKTTRALDAYDAVMRNALDNALESVGGRTSTPEQRMFFMSDAMIDRLIGDLPGAENSSNENSSNNNPTSIRRTSDPVGPAAWRGTLKQSQAGIDFFRNQRKSTAPSK